MTELNDQKKPADDTTSESTKTRPWMKPQLETHQAKELTKSGSFGNTDFGGLGNDCS